MAKYFIFPFGVSGDRASIPDTVQPDGSMSYPQGYGPDYQLNPDTDPDALNIPRDEFNELMYQTTLAIQQYQQLGFPDFISSADNGGTPFSYLQWAFVRYGGAVYYSLVDANVALPTDASKWAVFPPSAAIPQSFRTGDVVQTYDSTLPAGWLWVDGKTIGSAASGGTARANADTSDLFTTLWNSIPNAALPIQNSDGSTGSRGVSAAADFSSNKRMPLPDERGRVSAAADNLGGTAANRLTNTPSGGVDGTVVCNTGGAQGVTLDTSTLPTHTHGPGSLIGSKTIATNAFPDPTSVTGGNGSGGTTTFAISGATDSTGSGGAHNNVQPTIIVNKRIKL